MDNDGEYTEGDLRTFAWTNRISFEGVRLLQGFGEAELQDTLYWRRIETGLTSAEAEVLMDHDTYDEIKMPPGVNVKW